MAEQQAEEATITIDDVVYKLDDLSDNAKGQIQGIQTAEAEIKRLNIQVALVQTARNAYMHALQADLPANDE
jgi:hypothetical protein